MEKRQITRQELVAAALKLGARPGTIRQWFHRGIPYRWQIRLMEHFEGPVEISDWAPEATAAIAKPSIAETWRKKHMNCLSLASPTEKMACMACRFRLPSTG
jgi:hypothetical protein